MKINKEDSLRKIVIEGFALLQEEKNYKQNQIANKLRTLNSAVSTASLSNLLAKKAVGLDVLQRTAKGIEDIILAELGYAYFNNEFVKTKNPNWTPTLIKETHLTATTLENEAVLPGFVFHTEGRVTIQQKTNFIQSAQSDIIEVGVRLKTFADYFFSRNEQEYKAHIVALLKKGVKMRFYMLDPDSNEAALYFRDRTKAQEDETESINEMKKVLVKIQKIQAELAQEGFSGSFDIYLYKHLPTNHFFVVDGNSPNAKMMVSHYLYGLRRAECPVMEIDKHAQPLLFKKYYKSLQLFIADAKKMVPKVGLLI